MLCAGEWPLFLLFHATHGGIKMKESDVPQDQNKILEGGRKAIYAVDKQGRYTIAKSDGWEAEEIVTSMAVEALNIQAHQAKQRAKMGQSSPLEYHMYTHRMDLAILSQTTNIARWRIRRHFKPHIFQNLKPALFQRYADALDITIEELKTLPSDTEKSL